MKKIFNLIMLAIVTMIIGGIIAPTIANASITQSNQEENQAIERLDSSVERKTAYLIENYKLTESDLNDENVIELYNIVNPRTRIGTTTVAKAVLKVWHKLPEKIRKTILKVTTIGGFLKAIDHFTGTEYHIIYSALRYVGMSKNVSNWGTKIITFFM